MTDMNDVVSQLAALNAAMQSPQQQQPAWPAPSTSMLPAQAPPSMNIAALLQAMQQLGAQQQQQPAEPPILDEVRQMRANVASLSQQLEALAQAMQLMVKQVGLALARPTQLRPPPLPQQRTATLPSLPLIDPEHVRLVDDGQLK